jgi:hypothetical protein
MPAWFDVDTPDDLRRLQGALNGGGSGPEAGRTRGFLAGLRH